MQTPNESFRSGQLYKVTPLTPEQPISVKCMMKIFMGTGMVDGGLAGKNAGSGMVGWGSLMDLSKNILKQRVGKGKSCSQGRGVLKMSVPLPPPPPKIASRLPTGRECKQLELTET